MDTRVTFFLLVDYEMFYGCKKKLANAITLIRGIPSITLINYISGINVNLYIHDNDEYTGNLQFQLVNDILSKCPDEVRDKWVKIVKDEGNNGFMPIMFYSYSNLLFYNIIFENYNNYQCRDLNSEEARRFFDAYLIVNGCVNGKYQPDFLAFKKNIDIGHIENVIITNFIYQRDYASSLDLKIQANRGIEFFRFLEKDDTYRKYLFAYYKHKSIGNYINLFENILILIKHIGIGKKKRCQMVDLNRESNCVNEKYLDSLCINYKIDTYTDDFSFKTIRDFPLFKFDRYKFFVLDINFLINQFYKAQVFSINTFIKQNGGGNDFLSYKGKFFIEETILPKVLTKCFPNYIKFYSSSCKDSNGGELCDVYIRENNKICIIECKDVILNADIKNSGDCRKLFEEFDKKFVKNEKGKQKGITQLFKAIKDINDKSVSFDTLDNNDLEIYPVVVYTDDSYGIEGLNKYYRELFETKLDSIDLKVKVKSIVFINLSYFETYYEFYADNRLNIWKIIDNYNNYVKTPEYELTPFEIYTKFSLNLYGGC
ncbi:MAG: hypothetical protein J6T98_02675 [Salinivirgaceae bacterium]|nr:hypothetical protein [Salinivirgaceae bacterium]